jgi:LPS export ABC transporter permease LptG
LSDAVATTLPSETDAKGQYVSERLAQLRVVLETGRKGLLERLQKDEPEPDEMRLQELYDYARGHTGQERREALIVLHKRLSLSLAPVVFALLGASLSLRFRRGGKGWGSLVSLLTLIVYYMLSLLGDQLARKGSVEPYVGAWLATAVATAVSVFLLLKNRWRLRDLFRGRQRVPVGAAVLESATGGRRPLSLRARRSLGFPSILDGSLWRSLSVNCSFAYAALLAVFLIFTLFELWRFIVPGRAGMVLVANYLLFLLPLATVQLLPASLLIAVLVTYALIARRSEAIAWWASGQSVYRLMLPGVAFALVIGLLTWTVQERVMPQANIRQDALRAQIRGGVQQAVTGSGRQWLASPLLTPKRIYSYEYDEREGFLKQPVVYEFDEEGVHLSRIVTGERGLWQEDELLIASATTIQLKGARLEKREEAQQRLEGLSPEMFKLKLNKPAHLNSRQLSDYITALRPSGRNITPLLIALQRKYAEPNTAWIMALFGIPLALSFGRRSAVAALCYAVGISLAYWGTAGVFQQMGEYGLLSPTIAAWSPLLIFATLGVYLLTRMRT